MADASESPENALGPSKGPPTLDTLLQGQRLMRFMFEEKVRGLERAIHERHEGDERRAEMLHTLSVKIDNLSSVYLSQPAYFQFHREIESRVGVLEQQFKEAVANVKLDLKQFQDMASTIRDNRAVLREGTGSAPSVLTRLVRLEMDAVEVDKWRQGQKDMAVRNRQMMWALVVMIISNMISISWALLRGH